MTATRKNETESGGHALHPDCFMLNYGYDPPLSAGLGQAAGVPDLDLRFPAAEEGATSSTTSPAARSRRRSRVAA